MAELRLDARLTAAVATANDIAAAHPERFGMMLERILERLPSKDARAFSDSEESQLVQVLGASGAEDVRATVDLSETVFRRTCAKGLNLGEMGELTVTLGGSETLARALQTAWRQHGPKATKAIKSQSFGTPQYLHSVRWQVQVPLAGTDACAGAGPTSAAMLGTLDLTLASPGGTAERSGAGTSGGKRAEEMEALAVEFSKEELYGFLQDMEKIQGHLDQLS